MLPLPIDEILEEIKGAYARGENLIISATPGAGKTTRVAPALMHAGLIPPEKKILMMQPRRLAAKAVAARIAEENGWKLGGREVGYHVRFEKRWEKNTRLVVMTEGILARHLLDDPSLGDVACVILDEFHERSLHTDLALALLCESQAAFRPDLRILVMSATLDTSTLLKYLPRPTLCQAEGRVFPLAAIYQPKADRREYAKRLEDQVGDALRFLLAREDDDRGNILIFLPGIAEIRWCAEKIAGLKLRDVEILELHGTLSLEQQTKVLRPGSQRRIILSTNIAETSLTVPGVSSVIDSGLVRVMRWNPSRNLASLQLSRISLASAKQRAGRAARERPGRVYRLWSQEEELKFKEFEEPEIHRVDLAATLLTLAAWGVSDFVAFRWFEAPSPARVQSALKVLRSLGALDEKNQLTELGRSLHKIPLAPRFALALQNAKTQDREWEMALALSVLERRDPVVNAAKFKATSPSDRECDLASRAAALASVAEGEPAFERGMSAAGADACLKIARDLQNAVKSVSATKKNSASPHLGKLLWPAFRDRLCRRRQAGSAGAVMAGGSGVSLARESEVEKSEFFLAVDLREGEKDTSVFFASALSLAEIKELAGAEVREEIRAEVDLNTLRLQRTRQIVFRDLILEGPFPATGKDESDVHAAIQEARESILKNWSSFAERFDSLTELELRIRYLQKYLPELEVAELNDETKLAIVEAAMDFAKSASVDDLRMGELMQGLVPHDQLQKLNQHAPPRIEVPSGRQIKLHYSPDLIQVKCRVKLQELFGLSRSPTVLRDKVPIVFELISPRDTLLQTTSDLASFWKNAYPALRAEMKIKYHRHPWPEDPMAATATHRPLPRGKKN